MAEASKTERLDNWKKRWDNQEIRFHKLQPNPALVTYYDQLIGGGEPIRTILIPLCGKSLDMAWLYERGHTVVGIELTELAITSFFEEHRLEFTKQPVSNGFVYTSKDERIKLYEGDLFGFEAEVIGRVDAVWDRGSLVAVFKDERRKYVRLIRSFLKPHFRYLLETIEYDEQEAAAGTFQTPRSVTLEQVHQLYGDFCDIQVLVSVDKAAEIPNIKAKSVMQTDILLTNKSL